MRDTSVSRKVDELGRIVLPIGMRRKLNIKEKDELELVLDEEMIILKKAHKADIFSGDTEDLVEYDGKYVSKKTIRELTKLL